MAAIFRSDTPFLTATGGVSGTFGSLSTTNLPANLSTSLSYDAHDAYLNLVLNFVPPSGSGLNGNQQAVGNASINFFNSNGSIPIVFGSLTPAGLTQLSGETATGSQQTTFDAMSQFMGLLTDPFMQRNGTAGSTPGATGYADETSAYAANKKTDAFAMFTKAPVGADLRAALERVGGGLWRLAKYRRQRGGRIEQHHQRHRGYRGGRRLSDLAEHDRGVCARRRRHQFLGCQRRQRKIRSVPGRRLSAPHQRTGLCHRRIGLRLAGHHHQPYRSRSQGSTSSAREFNANAFSGRLEGGYRFVSPATGGVGITPYAAAQFVTFDLPAYAEQADRGRRQFRARLWCEGCH